MLFFLLSEILPRPHLSLDPEQERGVPGVEPGDLVVLLDLLREGVHVLVLDVLVQRLDNGTETILGEWPRECYEQQISTVTVL